MKFLRYKNTYCLRDSGRPLKLWAHWLTWKVSKKLSSRFVTSLKGILDPTISKSADITSSCAQYYKTLYDISSHSPDTICRFFQDTNFDTKLTLELDQPISNAAVMRAMQHLRSNKTPGHDGLSFELYKKFKLLLADHLTAICNNVMHTGQMPATWLEACIIVIPPKHRPSKSWNNSTYILIEHWCKFLMILAKRFNTIIGQYVHPDQSGFIQQRQISDNIKKN